MACRVATEMQYGGWQEPLMNRNPVNRMRTAGRCAILSLLAVSGLALAQEAPDAQQPAAPNLKPRLAAPSNGGWRRVGEPDQGQPQIQGQPQDSYGQAPAYPQNQNQAPYPSQNPGQYSSQAPYPYPSQAPYPNQAPSIRTRVRIRISRRVRATSQTPRFRRS